MTTRNMARDADLPRPVRAFGRILALACAFGLVFIAGATFLAALTRGDPLGLLFGLAFLCLAAGLAWIER